MTHTPSRIPWLYIALFYAVALGLAAPFNLGLADGWLRAHFSGTPLAVWTFLPAGLGPALGALLLCRLDRRTPRVTTYLGSTVGKNILAGLMPLFVFSVLGFRTAIYAAIAIAYASLEELGWRGYLADALGPLSLPAHYAFTALIWWPWHMRFTSAFDLISFPAIILASSFLLGHAARVSRSVFVAAGMHALVILLTASGPPSRAIALAGAATVLGWIVLGAVKRTSKAATV